MRIVTLNQNTMRTVPVEKWAVIIYFYGKSKTQKRKVKALYINILSLTS